MLTCQAPWHGSALCFFNEHWWAVKKICPLISWGSSLGFFMELWWTFAPPCPPWLRSLHLLVAPMSHSGLRSCRKGMMRPGLSSPILSRPLSSFLLSCVCVCGCLCAGTAPRRRLSPSLRRSGPMRWARRRSRRTWTSWRNIAPSSASLLTPRYGIPRK